MGIQHIITLEQAVSIRCILQGAGLLGTLERLAAFEFMGRWKTNAYTKVDLHSRPNDNRLAVCIRLQRSDSEDADDLDYGDEEAEGKDSYQADLRGASCQRTGRRLTKV